MTDIHNKTLGAVLAPARPGPFGSRTKAAIRDSFWILVLTLLLCASIELGIRTLLPQDLRTVVLNGGTLGQRDEQLGHVNRPGSHVRVFGPEFDVEYEVNAQGLRDRDTTGVRGLDPGRERILLLGDSFTFGAGGEHEEIWPTRVEEGLNKAGGAVEILNAGVPGYDTRLEVQYLERLYDVFRPQTVVLTFLPNDLFTNLPIAGAATGSRGAASPENLRRQGVVSGEKKSSLHAVTLLKRVAMSSDSIYNSLYTVTRRRNYFTPTAELDLQIDVTGALLAGARNFCLEKGCRFLIISIPQLNQVIADGIGVAGAGYDARYLDRRLEALAAELGIDWHSLLPDLSAVYKATGEDLYHRFDGHLNRDGNAVVAASVVKKLEAVLGEAGDPTANEAP